MSTYVLAQHQVEDFPKWKAVFDNAADLRQASGEKSAQIFHDAENPNKLTMLFEWDSIENAKKYSQNPDLVAAMQKAGVTGPPNFFFLNG
jgi:quinol monooxygenase YgiN